MGTEFIEWMREVDYKKWLKEKTTELKNAMDNDELEEAILLDDEIRTSIKARRARKVQCLTKAISALNGYSNREPAEDAADCLWNTLGDFKLGVFSPKLLIPESELNYLADASDKRILERNGTRNEREELVFDIPDVIKSAIMEGEEEDIKLAIAVLRVCIIKEVYKLH